MTTFAFIDVESTGLDSRRHEAWDIAVILREPGFSDAQHQWFIKPARMTAADPAALRIGRFYERTAALKPAGSREKAPKWTDPAKLAPELARMLDGAVLVGQNTWFDAGFISAFLAAHSQVLTADYHWQNLGSLLTGWKAGRGMPVAVPGRLDDLAVAAGADLALYDRHTALGDATLSRDLWDLVMGGPS